MFYHEHRVASLFETLLTLYQTTRYHIQWDYFLATVMRTSNPIAIKFATDGALEIFHFCVFYTFL